MEIRILVIIIRLDKKETSLLRLAQFSYFRDLLKRRLVKKKPPVLNLIMRCDYISFLNELL